MATFMPIYSTPDINTAANDFATDQSVQQDMK